jgi:FixJ family two-component response regulator
MSAPDEPIVFIVDDDEAAAASVAALMSVLGFASKLFPNADLFLESYESAQRGCLVLDIRLPGMNGLELFKTLRERGYEIPTILISGHMDSDACREALKEGALACLEKPYAGQDLCSLVQSAIGLE